jgi:transcriptional regulator with PAS, ATPase and Fis domain
MSEVKNIKQRFGIVGVSPLLDRAIEKALQVAPTDISVLVTGESGVGKESIPKIIHSLSHRKHEPYIAVNCGAIPEGTIDSELFGHEKGAFTGATGARKGYFEEAGGGTIFLDEVGELPMPSQVRLLRVLETGEFIRVGASRANKIDVRVVGATNVGMLDAIKNHKFREDLYYRLNTVEIHLPPLRERPMDIHLLFRKFCADFANKYHLPPLRLDDEAVRLLEQYRWPGNIRQLRNLAEQMSVIETSRLVGKDILKSYLPEVDASNLPALASMRVSDEDNKSFAQEREALYKLLFEMRSEINALKKVVGSAEEGVYEGLQREYPKIGQEYSETPQRSSTGLSRFSSTPRTQEDAEVTILSSEEHDRYEEEDEIIEIENLSLVDKEIELIKKALDKSEGKRKIAAKELGISERTLYRKIKQYNLD